MMTTSVKLSQVIAFIMVLSLLTGSYFGIRNLSGTVKAGEYTKAYEDDTDYTDGVIAEEKMQKGKKYVLEDDDLFVTVQEVDVSGKTYDQVKEGMRREAKKHGGIIGKDSVG